MHWLRQIEGVFVLRATGWPQVSKPCSVSRFGRVAQGPWQASLQRSSVFHSDYVGPENLRPEGQRDSDSHSYARLPRSLFGCVASLRRFAVLFALGVSISFMEGQSAPAAPAQLPSKPPTPPAKLAMPPPTTVPAKAPDLRGAGMATPKPPGARRCGVLGLGVVRSNGSLVRWADGLSSAWVGAQQRGRACSRRFL